MAFYEKYHTTIHFRRESREERTETKFETYNLLFTRSMPREVVFNDENIKKSLFSALSSLF